MNKKSIRYSLLACMTTVILVIGMGGVSFASQPLNLQKTSEESVYIEGEALVLLESDIAEEVSGLTKNRTGDALALGSDIEVEAVYDLGSYEITEDGQAADGRKTAAAEEEIVNVEVVKVVSDSLPTDALIKKLNGNKKVKLAAPNMRVHALGASTYTDEPYSRWLWGMASADGDAQWDLGTGADEDEKVIAIVDTGVEYTHEDLKDRMWVNPFGAKLRGTNGYDFVNNDANPIDDNGHGTHCAGIISGEAGNNVGISGISGGYDNVRIMALKFLDEEGSGTTEGALASYAYIAKAQKLGVNVVAINNSWGSSKTQDDDDDDDEGFDDDEAALFREVFNAVGASGALSVCAAGNSASNNDEDDGWWGFSPCNTDSDYCVSVAATAEGGENLAYFSNYGERTVDLAAPGGDILSSVSYDCFNPSLYFDNEQLVSGENSYNFDFESDEELTGFLSQARLITKDYDGPAADYAQAYADWQDAGEDMNKKSPEVNFSLAEGFQPYDLDREGKALQIDIKRGDEEKGYVILGIPYNREEGTKPSISAMMKGIGPDYFWMPNIAGMVEGSSEMTYNDFLQIDSFEAGAYFDVGTNTWDHAYFKTKKANPGTRYCYYMITTDNAGDDTLYIDDFAVSAQDDTSLFGRYDFYSGTSMATPYVTGAVVSANKYIESKTSEEISLSPGDEALAAKELLLASVVKKDFLDGMVATGGVLNLSDDAFQNATVIFSAKLEDGVLKITGTGFNQDMGISIEAGGKVFTRDDYAFTIDENTITSDDPELIAALANRIVTITLEGEKTSSRTVFLSYDKTDYIKQEVELPEQLNNNGLFTDGSKLYSMYCEDKELLIATYDGDGAFDTNSYGELFQDRTSEDPEIVEVRLKSKPVVIGHHCYVIIEGDESVDDYPSFSSETELIDVDLTADVGEEPDEDLAFGMTKDSSEDMEDGAIRQIALPQDTEEGHQYAYSETVAGQALGAYNGKLYLIGGYDFEKTEFSKSVYIYDLAKKEWSQGPALPAGRYGGEALQTGNTLIYALGADENSVPADGRKWISAPSILAFDGTGWEVKKDFTVDYDGFSLPAGAYTERTVELGNHSYYYCDGHLNLINGGVLLTGTFFDGMGDTVVYQLADNTLTPSIYHFISDPEAQWIDTVVVADTLYGIGYDGEDTAFYQIKDQSQWKSGLLKVSCSVNKKIGKVTGSGKSYLPGSQVSLKAVSAKNHYFKSMTALKAQDGKDIKVTAKKNTKPKNSSVLKFTIMDNTTVKVSFGNYVTKITLNKTKATVQAGKKVTLKVKKILPKNADNKKVTWKSSNKKYATVTSKGVVTTKRAGKGKTVTITCTARDGSKKKATCKIKIK